MTKDAQSVLCPLYNFRGTAAFVVIGNLEVLGIVPVDVDLAVVLVDVQGAEARTALRHFLPEL